jgi:hypothetical protein
MARTENLKKKGEALAEEIKEKGKALKEDVKQFAKKGLSGGEGNKPSGGKDAKMPERDISGDCEGECRDRVKEGESERQSAIESDTVEAPEDYPKAPGANKRNDPPGSMGGKV